jgi:uncharacterized repeat protein (TIGR01451 family)
VAGGFIGCGIATATAELYDPATGTWSVTGSMSTARGTHTATLLPNGTVLVAGGGSTGGVATATAELYDPATGTWSVTGSMSTARAEHGGWQQQAPLLPNGQVLVAGGRDVADGCSSQGGTATATAELYDPVTGTWSVTGSMAVIRQDHEATLLPNGTVLVEGGQDGINTVYDSAELYDPATGTWSVTGSMSTGRRSHEATLLDSGEVLVPGGATSSGVAATAEIYDPATGTWSVTGSMTFVRAIYSSTLLLDGTVLVAGGVGGGSSAELYDPATGTWSLTGSMNTSRVLHTATRLLDGTVLVAGGNGGDSSAELYDPAAPVTADLSLTKADTPDPVLTGKNLTYTLTVSNAGPSAVDDAVLNDPLPANTTFQSLTAPAGWSCTTPAVGSTGTVTCGPASLEAGATASFTLVVKVSGAAGGTTLSNTATVSSDEFDPTDPNTANNSATATTTVTTPSQALKLTVAVQGQGTVTSSPAGINCRPTCSAAYSSGTQVTLSATPAAGLRFTGWSGGGCQGTGTCVVTLTTADIKVTATFKK